MKHVSRVVLSQDDRKVVEARIEAARRAMAEKGQAQQQFTPPSGPVFGWSDETLMAAANSCMHCYGGYLPAPDVLPGHPDFGKLQPCHHCAPYRTELRNRELRRQMADSLKRYDLRSGLEHKTFENYTREPDTEEAYASVRSWALAIIGKARATEWLYLYGRPGNGKTHLSAAAANGLGKVAVGMIFTRTPEMVAMIRAASLEDREQIIRLFQTVPVLILDDFGTEALTDWAAEMMFRVIDWRYVNRYPLLVTSQIPPEHISEIRIRSRFSDTSLCACVQNRGEDFRPRTGQMRLL